MEMQGQGWSLWPQAGTRDLGQHKGTRCPVSWEGVKEEPLALCPERPRHPGELAALPSHSGNCIQPGTAYHLMWTSLKFTRAVLLAQGNHKPRTFPVGLDFLEFCPVHSPLPLSPYMGRKRNFSFLHLRSQGATSQLCL